MSKDVGNVEVEVYDDYTEYKEIPEISTWEKISEKEFDVNTESTTATSVGTISLGSKAFDKDKILFISVKNKAGKQSGNFLESMTFIINYRDANDSSEAVNSFAREIYWVGANDEYSRTSVTGSTGYGVYPSSLASDGTLSIYARYNDNYGGTINGTFVVSAYLIDWARGTNPFE